MGLIYHYKPMDLQNVGTGRHENMLNLAEDMLLFTSNNVTLVSFQQVFKMTTFTPDMQLVPF